LFIIDYINTLRQSSQRTEASNKDTMEVLLLELHRLEQLIPSDEASHCSSSGAALVERRRVYRRIDRLLDQLHYQANTGTANDNEAQQCILDGSQGYGSPGNDEMVDVARQRDGDMQDQLASALVALLDKISCQIVSDDLWSSILFKASQMLLSIDSYILSVDQIRRFLDASLVLHKDNNSQGNTSLSTFFLQLVLHFWSHPLTETISSSLSISPSQSLSYLVDFAFIAGTFLQESTSAIPLHDSNSGKRNSKAESAILWHKVTRYLLEQSLPLLTGTRSLTEQYESQPMEVDSVPLDSVACGKKSSYSLVNEQRVYMLSVLPVYTKHFIDTLLDIIDEAQVVHLNGSSDGISDSSLYIQEYISIAVFLLQVLEMIDQDASALILALWKSISSCTFVHDICLVVASLWKCASMFVSLLQQSDRARNDRTRNDDGKHDNEDEARSSILLHLPDDIVWLMADTLVRVYAYPEASASMDVEGVTSIFTALQAKSQDMHSLRHVLHVAGLTLQASTLAGAASWHQSLLKGASSSLDEWDHLLIHTYSELS
jgi:hypothetical protein